MRLSTALRLLLAASLVTAVVVGAGAVAGSVHDRRPAAPRQPSALLTAPAAEVRAAAVLHAWDAARAGAWAAGDLRSLGDLYTPGSLAGERDREMLREWLRRGLVVRDLRTQVLALRELRRTAGTWVLRVTDRVAAGTAAGRGLTRSLPRDSATTTIVTLRRQGGRWLVQSVSATQS
jgi:hypothetical protein